MKSNIIFRTRFDRDKCIERLSDEGDFKFVTYKTTFILQKLINFKRQSFPPFFIFSIEQKKRYVLISGKVLPNPLFLLLLVIWFLSFIIMSIFALDSASDAQFLPGFMFIAFIAVGAIFITDKVNKTSKKEISRYLLKTINARQYTENAT